MNASSGSSRLRGGSAAKAARRSSRIDQPLAHRRSMRVTPDPEAIGRMSERIARFLGSWRFIGYMSAFVGTWVLWNVLAPQDLRFDEWPFIGLTLLLSLQASYAAPLILLAANRQADRDRVQYNEDRSRDERIVADVDFLAREVAALRIAIGEVATRDYLRSEIRELSELLSPSEPSRGKGKMTKKTKTAAKSLPDPQTHAPTAPPDAPPRS